METIAQIWSHHQNANQAHTKC